MVVLKVILFFALINSIILAEDLEKRPTRTIARLLGFESNRPPPQQQQQQQQQQPQQQQQQQPQQQIPLVYNVKYYDRTGENPEVQVEQAQVQQQQQVIQQHQQGQYQPVSSSFQERVAPSTRVFLNLYTGQQTPVYYDSKGQLYVPCPAYDHHHQVHSGTKPIHLQAQKSVVGQSSQVAPAAEYIYYTGTPPLPPLPQQQQQQQQQKQVHQQRPLVGVGQQVVPYVSPLQLPITPEVLYYATPQQQQQLAVGYPHTLNPNVVSYNPYEVPYAYFPSSYGYPGHVGVALNKNGQVVYQSGQGGYVNPFVYVKPAQVTVAPGQSIVTHPHAHVHVQQQQQQTDQVVVEKKNVSEKTDVQQQ